jgi:hypothetical protein
MIFQNQEFNKDKNQLLFMAIKAKAQMSFTSGNALKLLLILIIGVSFVTFVTYGSGNINNFMMEVCEKYPDLPFCVGIESDTTDYLVAKNSVQALTCAINSVSAERELECIQQFKPGQSSPLYEELSLEQSASVVCSSQSSVAGESPTIEYEEGGGVWFIGGWDNACYKFNDNQKWLWKLCKDKEFKPVSTGLEKDMVAAYYYLQDALKDAGAKGSAGYEEGLKAFANVLNNKSVTFDGKKDKTSDDTIRIIYIDGRKTKWVGDGDDDIYVRMSDVGRQIIGNPDSNRVNLAFVMNYKPAEGVDVVLCTVSGFYLPQEVSNAEKWIAGYGDPNFLVYWQDFPAGEDAAWTTYATWMENVGTVVLFAIPVGKVLKGGKYLIKGGGKTVASGASTAMTSAGSKLVNKLAGRTAAKNVQLVLFDTSVSRVARIAAIAKAAGKGMFKELIWGAERHYGVGLKPLLKIAGVTTVASWAGAYIDSVNDKYIKRPESMVMDSPYKEPETFDLSQLTKPPQDLLFGYSFPLGIIQPVILHRTGLFENPTTFYAASPCHADLKVEMNDLTFCKEYTYNTDDEVVVCSVASESDVMSGDWFLGRRLISRPEDLPNCGEIDISLQAVENNQLFKDTNGDGEFDEVILSHLTSGMDVLKINDPSYSGIFNNYEIRDGEKTIISTGSFKGEIDFESDGVFDATFETINDPQGIKLEITRKGEDTPFCTNINYGIGGTDEQYVLHLTDETTIDQLRYAEVDLDDNTCYLRHVFTPPIKIMPISGKVKVGASDGIGVGAFTLADKDGDGYWDEYDAYSDLFPDLYFEKDIATVTTYKCKISAVSVSIENKGNYDDDQNFCYSKPQTGTRIAIIVGVIIADVVMEYFSAGLLTQVAVGLTGGAMYVASQQYEKWP